MHRTTTTPWLRGAAGATLLLGVVACGESAEQSKPPAADTPVAPTGAANQGAPAGPAPATATASTAASADADADRGWLLEQAMGVSNSIPSRIHDRERAQCQEWVVLGYLEAGDPLSAARCAESIDGWRRGECEGLIGVHYALKGDRDLALKYARLAEDRSKGQQDWRRERMLIEAAKVHAILGNAAVARELSAGASEAEIGKVEGAVVSVLTPDQFEAQTKILDAVLASGTFDGMRNALDAYLPLVRRMTDQRALALAAADRIDKALPSMPMDLQIIYGTRLAGALHALGETDRAQRRLGQAADQVAATTFLPEDLTPMQVEVAKARAELGDAAGARAALDAALASYEARKKEIVDVFRARSPRALAEGYALLGDHATSETCYLEALSAGSINPNSRPRAEDLTATLVSMARSRAAATPALRAKIQTCRKGLGDPW